MSQPRRSTPASRPLHTLVAILLCGAAALPLATSAGAAARAGLPSRACSGAFAKPSALNVAFQAIPNGEPIVKHERWLEAALGIKVNWSEFNSGAEVNTAMASGSVDIGLAGTSPVAAGISRGLAYVTPWIYDIEGHNEALVVKAREKISSVRDLVGKTVAVPFVSTTHYSLLSALAVYHVDPNRVTIIDMQPKDALAAWLRGSIDASYVWQPVLGKMIAAGGRVILDSSQMARLGYVTGDLAVVRSAFARQYPCVVSTWITQEARAVDLYRRHPDRAAADVGADLGINTAEARREMRELNWLGGKEQLQAPWLGTVGHVGGLADDLHKTALFLVRQKVLPTAPPLDTFRRVVTPLYLQNALGS